MWPCLLSIVAVKVPVIVVAWRTSRNTLKHRLLLAYIWCVLRNEKKQSKRVRGLNIWATCAVSVVNYKRIEQCFSAFDNLQKEKNNIETSKCLNVVIATDKTVWKLFFELGSMDILYDLFIEAKVWIRRKIISIQSKLFSSINLCFTNRRAHWWWQKMTEKIRLLLLKFNRDKRRIFSFWLALKIIFKNIFV